MNPPPAAQEPETATVPDVLTGQQRRVVVGGAGWSKTFSAMRHRNFRLFFAGQLVSLIGTWMEAAATGWLIYLLTGSTLLLGIVSAAGSAPMVFLSMWGGWVADHYPKRSVLVATQTASMLLAFTTFAVVWTGVVQPWQIIAISLMNGVVMAFDMPARQAFTVEMTSRKDLLNAISLNNSCVNGARIIGPAMAGVIMAKTSLAFCFFINGVSFLAVIASLLMMRVPGHVRPTHTETAWRQAMSGFTYVWNDFQVLTLLALFGIVGTFGWSYAVLLPAFAKDVLHVEEAAYGMMMAAAGAGAFTGAILLASIGHDFPKRAAMLGGIWLYSAMLIILSFNRIYGIALVVIAISSFGMMMFFSVSNTLIQMNVPDAMRGRVMGVWSIIFGAMIPLGSLEAGSLAHLIGIPATITLNVSICAIAAGVVLFLPAHRDTPKACGDAQNV